MSRSHRNVEAARGLKLGALQEIEQIQKATHVQDPQNSLLTYWSGNKMQQQRKQTHEHCTKNRSFTEKAKGGENVIKETRLQRIVDKIG